MLLRCCSRLGYAVVLNYSWLRSFPFCAGFVPQWKSLGDDREVTCEEDMWRISWGVTGLDSVKLLKTWHEILDQQCIRK